MYTDKITQAVAEAVKQILATEKLHPNQQKLDVHEPEKDELTADDFKKLRAKKEVKKEEVEQIVEYETNKDGKFVHNAKAGRYGGSEKPQDPFAGVRGPGQKNLEKIEAEKKKKLDINAINGVKMSNVDESSHQAKTTMKHIPNASPELKKAAKDIKPGIAGFRDRVAMLKAGGVKE